MPLLPPACVSSHRSRGMLSRDLVVLLATVAVVLLLVVVLSILVAGRLRQQSAVIERQSQALDALSRRVADLESQADK